MQRAAQRQRVARKRLVRAYRGAASTRRVLQRPSSMSQRRRGELKLLDGIPSTPSNIIVPLNTTMTNVIPVNLCRSGPGVDARIGRRISMTSLHVKGVITQTTTVTTINDYARFAVIYDRQTNGVVPTADDIFQDLNVTTSTTPGSGIKIGNAQRFVVLADIRMSLPAVAATGIDGSTDPAMTTFNINRFIKLPSLATVYKGDSTPSVIADISTGGLYVVGMGSIASGSEGWKFVGTWRLRYTDV